MSDGPSHASSFDDNDYSRPNQPWACGWAAEGHACPLGPTKWGLCRSSHECSPYKKGDTWTCARTKAHGGPCDDGPMPDGTCCKQIQKCQPVRSVMSRRGILSFAVFATALAAAFIILGAPNRQQLASPGELTSHHSQVADRCEACHVGSAGNASDWIEAAFDSTAALVQSDQCLACHEELGPSANFPHGQAAEVLTKLTSVVEHHSTTSIGTNTDLLAAKSMRSQHSGSHSELACAACHREHRGSNASLTEVTNQQCQVCHADAFDSFSHGHPELTDYPYERRTRLYFDHQSHYGDHFAADGNKKQRTCQDCHEPDSAGRYMLVKSFESTCAECHSHQIEDDTTLGLAIMSLPNIDVESLRKNGRKIGQWPSEYPLHVEATPTIAPLQQLILESYDECESVMSQLTGVDLSDLREADTPQLQAAESLVWLIKQSLSDIVQRGHPDIKQRLASMLGDRVSQDDISSLTNAFPLTATTELQRAWLPELLEEVEAHRNGLDIPAASESNELPTAETIIDERQRSDLLASGWYLHGSSLSLRYRPIGHADVLMQTMFDIGATGGRHAASTASLDSTLNNLFQQVSSPFSVGRCTKCHTVDANEQSTTVNWRAYEPPLDHHDFTRFNHAPHTTLLRDDACSECHAFAKSEAPATELYHSSFFDKHWSPTTNPHDFTSNFSPMSKESCATCHTKETGRDQCLTCHNYHVR